MSEVDDIHAELIRVAKKYHPVIAELICANGVIELKGRDEKDLFNFLARTVTGQQLSTAAAKTIWKRLNDYASKNKTALQTLCVKQNETKLRECGLSNNKIKALMVLTKAFDNKEISKQKILMADYKEISEMITRLWGFGQWSADMVAIFYVQHPDIWPVGDGAIVRGIKNYAGDSASSVEVAEKYSPYQTYLALHIWKGLDTNKKK